MLFLAFNRFRNIGQLEKYLIKNKSSKLRLAKYDTTPASQQR